MAKVIDLLVHLQFSLMAALSKRQTCHRMRTQEISHWKKSRSILAACPSSHTAITRSVVDLLHRNGSFAFNVIEPPVPWSFSETRKNIPKMKSPCPTPERRPGTPSNACRRKSRSAAFEMHWLISRWKARHLAILSDVSGARESPKTNVGL
jgi:hypothetical protein